MISAMWSGLITGLRPTPDFNSGCWVFSFNAGSSLVVGLSCLVFLSCSSLLLVCCC
jgi:hypothetical protein